MRIGGLGGQVLQSSASCRSRSPAATSTRRSRRARSTPRMGRPLRRREARLPQGRALLLLSRLVGRRPDASRFVNLAKWNELPKSYQASSPPRHYGQHMDAGALRHQQPGGAQAPGRRRRTAAALPPRSWKPASRRPPTLRRDLGQERRLQEAASIRLLAFRGDDYLWWQVAEYTPMTGL